MARERRKNLSEVIIEIIKKELEVILVAFVIDGAIYLFTGPMDLPAYSPHGPSPVISRGNCFTGIELLIFEFLLILLAEGTTVIMVKSNPQPLPIASKHDIHMGGRDARDRESLALFGDMK